MTGWELDNDLIRDEEVSDDTLFLLERIRNSYRVLKLCEDNLNEASNDYGKQKIARLRLDFAKHELETLLEEARKKGINDDIDDELFNKNIS